MIVYFAFNTVTEMSYVGATKFTLEDRKRFHYNKAIKGKYDLPKFGLALIEWPAELWEWYVLEECSTVEELDEAEQRWQHELHTLESGVGYNSYDGRYLKSVNGGEQRRRKATEARLKSLTGNLPGVRVRQPRKLDGLTTEEKHEFFRRCGYRAIGITNPEMEMKRDRLPKGTWKSMSDDERRNFLKAAGKKGAVVSKEKLSREILKKR